MDSIARPPVVPTPAAAQNEFGDSSVARRRSRRLLMVAVAFWVVPMVVISIMVFARPSKRTVIPLYREASTHWWSREPLYQGPGGMNYLPQFAILFTPFNRMPAPAGDILWRLLSAAVVATGLARVVRLRFETDWARWFLGATIIALPLCLGSLQTGQANALLGGVLLHAAGCLACRQWHRAAALIVLTLAIKPLGAVMVLLAPLVYVPLRWRIALGLVTLIALPLLFGPPAYVVAQYRDLGRNLRDCAAVSEHRFADLNGILRTFGTELPPQASTIARATAGLVTAALWWFGARRLREPLQAMWLHALATSYLMLFNPMNETNSYGILAPALGFWAVDWLSNPDSVHRGRVLGTMSLSMGVLPGMLRPWLGNSFALIWHPAMTLIFIVLLALFVWHQPATERLQPRCS
ncbi:MAG: DUF2029 domain-containing protein [Verrucomicrobiae bacterium]|nr:DUF2029 domain-containing protein [Verrucomicrobiae bacterium]